MKEALPLLDRSPSVRIGCARTNSLRVAMVSAALTLAAACASNAKRSDAPRRVAASELPAAQRDAWESYRAGGARWEVARESALADPSVARFVVDNLVIDMVRAYERSAIAHAGERAGPFERAQAELVLFASEATPVLGELLRVGDGVVAFLAADTLKRIGEPAIGPALAQLEDSAAATRRRAAELLAALPPAHESRREEEVLKHLADHLRTDGEWIVRAEAARTIGARGATLGKKDPALRPLLAALKDPDAAVAEMASRGLELLGDARAIPSLVDALERAGSRGSVACVRATERALATLSGTSQGRTPAAWRTWWEAHQAELVRPVQVAR